jgi:hypothetical protein
MWSNGYIEFYVFCEAVLLLAKNRLSALEDRITSGHKNTWIRS